MLSSAHIFRDLGIGYKTIVFMTRKGPTSVEWLTPIWQLISGSLGRCLI
jgi:hypothetical protein